MSGSRLIRSAAIAIVAIILAVVVLRVVPIVTGPALPTGATRLHIATELPGLTLGCHTALIAPARVATFADELVLVSVASGEQLRVVWPSGFAAWRLAGRAELADPWGSIIGREGDVLDTLGGGLGSDNLFHICPYGLLPRSS